MLKTLQTFYFTIISIEKKFNSWDWVCNIRAINNIFFFFSYNAIFFFKTKYVQTRSEKGYENLLIYSKVLRNCVHMIILYFLIEDETLIPLHVSRLYINIKAAIFIKSNNKFLFPVKKKYFYNWYMMNHQSIAGFHVRAEID